MKKSVTKNYVYNLSYQILIMIVPLFTTPYISRVLGAESIGIFSYTVSIATYFILFGSLGVAMYGQREIAYVQNDQIKRSIVFWEILIMRFITLGLSLFVFYITFVLNGQYSNYYKILIIEIVANALDISWLFQGMEEFKKTVIRNTIVKLISVVAIFTLVKSTGDLYKYFIIYVISTLLGNMSLWLYLPKYIERVDFKKIKILRHLKPTISLFIPQVAVQMYTVLDKTMLGTIIADKSEVGFYEQSQKIIKLLLTLATSFGTVMVPRMANTFANGDKQKIREYMNKSFSFILMIVFPLMFGIISISYKFVPIFFGQGYDKIIYLIIIISPILVAIGLSSVIGTQYLLPTKQQKKYTISVVLGASVNFILNLIFINLWQSIGAAIATVIAECTVTGVQFYLVRKEIDIRKVCKITKDYLISSFIMCLISLILGYLITKNLLAIIIQIFISALVYFGVLLVLKNEMVLEGIKIIKSKVRQGEK